MVGAASEPRWRAAAFALAAACGLAACGGGLYIGYSDDDFDRAPSVSVTSAAASVVAGGTLRVAAAAADEDGIDNVTFFRRDFGGWTAIVEDRREPYEADIPVPNDGRTTIEIFARATDRVGRQADSRSIAVGVVR